MKEQDAMSTAGALITSLKSVTAEELRRELQERRATRDAFLAESDREMEMIERLIDVVEPRTERYACSQAVSTRLLDPPVTVPPVSQESTRAIEVTRQEFVQSDPATVLGTLSDAMEPPKRPSTRRAAKILASTPINDQISTYLEAMGPSACGKIAHDLHLNRDEVDTTLILDGQFTRDDRGFWDLKAKIEARKERELRPINQVT